MRSDISGSRGQGTLSHFSIVSLASDADWDASELSIEISELTELETIQESDELVLHASTPEHVDEHAPRFEARSRQIVEDGADLVRQRATLVPYVRFCSQAKQTLLKIREDDIYLPWVKRCIFELNDVCKDWTEGEFPHHSLRSRPSPESETVYNNYALKSRRIFRCHDGQDRYFPWHLKNRGFNLRLHYFPKADERIVLIGYIGPHLPTGQY